MKILILSALIISMLWPQKPLTINEAVKYSLKHNSGLLQAEMEMSKARAQSLEARSTALPVVQGFVSTTRNLSIAGQPVQFPIPFGVIDTVTNQPVPLPNDPTLQETQIRFIDIDFVFGSDNQLVYGVNFTQPLFEGRVFSAIRASKIYDRMTTAGYQAEKGRTIEATRKAFYQVLLAEKVLTVVEKAIKRAQKNYENVYLLYEKGNVSELDKIRAEVLMSQQETRFFNAHRNMEISRENLKKMMGMPMEEEISVSGGFIENMADLLPLADFEKRLLQHQPALAQVHEASYLMRENVSAVRSEFYPSIALTGNFSLFQAFDDGTFSTKEFDSNQSLGLNINMPIFNGMGSKARLDKARAEYRKSIYQEQDVKSSMLLELKNIYLTILASDQKIDEAEKTLELARRGLEVADELYAKGLISQMEQLDADMALVQAELGLYQAQYEYSVAWAAMDRALGENIRNQYTNQED